jgi:signal-transduction protein with cAMP-binding, CBS, and nucleotidyltransferase domain
MSRVSDIVCQRELFRVEEYHSVAEVARRMTDLHVGAILVFNGDQLRGIFSERDLMKRVVVECCDPERTAVGLVMSTEVVTIDESASLE